MDIVITLQLYLAIMAVPALFLAAGVTESRWAEGALKSSQALYHDLVETAQDLIWQCDADGRYIYLNPAWEEVFGYKKEEMLGKRFSDFQTPEYAERDLKEFARLMKGNSVKGLETVHLGKDGREIHLVFNAKLLVDAQGNPAGTRGTAYDIIERKRAEYALRALSTRQEAILAAVPDIIMEVDNNKVYTWANQAGLEFFGDDVIGKEAAFYFEGEQDTYGVVQPLFNGAENVFYIESWQRRKDGQKRLLAWWCRALKDESGNVTGALSSTRDITERKKAEEELSRYREHLEELVKERTTDLRQTQDALTNLVDDLNEKTRELQQANVRITEFDRLKSAFLATMSHELRTPLNSIIGFTGIVLQGMSGPLNEEQAKQLAMVKSSANHLLALINDVLDISKIEAGQVQILRRSFDMRSVIEQALRAVIPLAAKKGISLDSVTAPDVGPIISDQRRVTQILINLLNNAVKFTERGTARISARRVRGEERRETYRRSGVTEYRREKGGSSSVIPAPPSVVSAEAGIQEPVERHQDSEPHADSVEISVEDTGIGIKPEDMGKLFKPFRQLETGLTRNYEGTGLGLSICEKLVKMLGGTIRAGSEWGKGSTFTFTLPL